MSEQLYRGKELSVGLLLSDLLVAKNISRIFRKIGIVPHLYESLTDLFEEKSYPALLISDVRLMSDGELVLSDLEVVREEKLPLAFYYDQADRPLLVSTYNLFHLGLISGDGALEGQVKGVLKRLNHFLRLEQDGHRLKYLDDQHKREVRSLYQRMEQFKQFHFYNEELSRLTRLIEAQKVQGDFYAACEKVFENESVIKSFTFFELSMTGQKLMTPTSACKKFHKIPSLWLKDACLKGIDSYAQNLASQVSVELMGDNLVALHLRSRFSQPSALFFLKIEDSDFLSFFDWDLFETYLNGLYSHFELSKQRGVKNMTKTSSVWSIYSALDEQMYATLSGKSLIEEEEWKVIHLSFRSLLNYAADTTSIRFYWDSFYKDFVKTLFEKSDIEFTLSPTGASDLTFLVQEDDKEAFFDLLKDHCKTFSYWRYFEDSDTVLTRDFSPEIKMLPNSTKAIKDYLTGALASLYGEDRTSPHREISSRRRDSLLLGSERSTRLEQ